MANFMTANMLDILGDGTPDSREFRNSRNLSIMEMALAFGQETPYHITVGEDGNTFYTWNPNFIDKVLYVMSTDDTLILNDKETEALLQFIDYEDELISNSELLESMDAIFTNIYTTDDNRVSGVLYDGLVDVSPIKRSN